MAVIVVIFYYLSGFQQLDIGNIFISTLYHFLTHIINIKDLLSRLMHQSFMLYILNDFTQHIELFDNNFALFL